MPQQVWAFLATTNESWAIRDLARILDLSSSTIRGQLTRLTRAGKVEKRYWKGCNCIVYRRSA